MNVMEAFSKQSTYTIPAWYGHIGDWIVAKKAKKKIFILSNNEDSLWLTAVTEALKNIGKITIWTEEQALAQFCETKPGLLLIDASTLENDVVPLVQILHLENEGVPIVVATTSPTWRRARAVLMAGAVDYIGRSFEQETILAKCTFAMDQSDIPIVVNE